MPGLLLFRLGKFIVIVLPVLVTASIAQSLGLDQHDRSEYKRDMAYAKQGISQSRHALRVEKIRIAKIVQESGGMAASENRIGAFKILIRSYTKLDSCLSTQRVLLRPSDNAWIYCRAESGLSN